MHQHTGQRISRRTKTIPTPFQVQQDEHTTKKIEGFTGRITVPANAVVSGAYCIGFC